MPPSIRSDNLENISKDLNKPCEEVCLRQSHCQCSSGHLTRDMITRRESPISGLSISIYILCASDNPFGGAPL